MDANFGVIRFKADIRLKFPVGVSPTLNKNPSAYRSQIGFYLIGSFKKCDVLHSTLILFSVRLLSMNIAMKAVGFWLFWSNRLLLYLCFVEVCPDGWLNYGSSCYYVKDTVTRKQSDARQHCQNLGGDLAIIKSENQNDFIFNLIRSQNTFTKWGAWIGMERKPDGKFYWIDNTPEEGSYSIWSDGEPNNFRRSENCVQMYGNSPLEKEWNDLFCEVSEVELNNAPVIVCQRSMWGVNWQSALKELAGTSKKDT